tara:strand:- start:832 stop:1860 length:1029 start_codon:yes stop_codon:yes gene_type:complete
MKILLFIFVILIFLTKSENTFSNSGIFTVNNIEIKKENFKNKQQLLNLAIKKAFSDLSKRILLKQDIKKIANTSLLEIQGLISHYQINLDIIETPNYSSVNIFFDRDKVHNFLYKLNIQYSDLENEEILIFPIIIKDSKIFLFDDNYLYKNWNNESKELIEFILPVENIEIIEKILANKEEIENIEINDLIPDYETKNKVFLIAEIFPKKSKLFIKLFMDDKKLVKNLEVTKDGNINFNEKIISFAKSEIQEIYKSQNMIDLAAPSFLNIKLEISKDNDLFILDKFLDKIEIIDSYNIQKLTSENVSVRIKYYGKVDKLFKKLSLEGIKIKNINNEWVIKII